MVRTIVTTIDDAGRLVVPKEIRDQAGLEPDTPLRIRYSDGRIEIEQIPRSVRIRRRGRLSAAMADEDGEPLRADSVEEVIQEVRTRRKGR